MLTRLDQSGNKKVTHVPAEGLLFARQRTEGGASVLQTYRNPLGTTETNKAVYDPLGNYIPYQAFADPRPPAGSYSSASMGALSGGLANPDAYGTGCMLDGLPTNCSLAMRLLNNGVAAQCPENNCGPYSDPNRDGPGRRGWVEPLVGPYGVYYGKIGPSNPGKGHRMAGTEGKADPQNPQELTRDEVASLIDSVFKYFKKQRQCEDAINEILGQLKSKHNAGSIADILNSFSKNGAVSVYPHNMLSGVADPWPKINISSEANRTRDALTVMEEIIHSAGKFPDGKGGYTSHFSDAAIANVLIKSGVVMSVEQYRHTYADLIKRQRQQGWAYDYAESALAHGGIAILCEGAVNGVAPQSVKP